MDETAAASAAMDMLLKDVDASMLEVDNLRLSDPSPAEDEGSNEDDADAVPPTFALGLDDEKVSAFMAVEGLHASQATSATVLLRKMLALPLAEAVRDTAHSGNVASLSRAVTREWTASRKARDAVGTRPKMDKEVTDMKRIAQSYNFLALQLIKYLVYKKEYFRVATDEKLRELLTLEQGDLLPLSGMLATSWGESIALETGIAGDLLDLEKALGERESKARRTTTHERSRSCAWTWWDQ